MTEPMFVVVPFPDEIIYRKVHFVIFISAVIQRIGSRENKY